MSLTGGVTRLYPGYMSERRLRPMMPSGPVQQIHIKLPADLHRRLRVRCALEDITIQAFVEGLVEQAVAGVALPEAQ